MADTASFTKHRAPAQPGDTLGIIPAILQTAPRGAHGDHGYRSLETAISVLDLPVRKVAHVHLLNTATFLAGLQEAGLIADGADIMSEINGKRPTALLA